MLSDRPIVAGANWAAGRRIEADATREKKQGADLIVPPISQRLREPGDQSRGKMRLKYAVPISPCALARQTQQLAS